KEADWLGKLWARWGDALREAGFLPNEMQGAYDKTELLELYVALARELGRLPTANDMRLKGRADHRFPNQKTFERFGPKEKLVQQVAEYCRGKGGSDDVLRWCDVYVPRRKDTPADEQLTSEATDQIEIGFVYLMKSGRYYKIGRSNSAGRREYEL